MEKLLNQKIIFADENELIGAGATFPYPLYSKMFSIYNQETNVRVNYQSIGSGGGINQLKNKTVDFGASDAFLTDDEIKSFQAEVIHIPTCLGAVSVTYNLPGSPQLNFSGDVLADIFLGKITKWNDEKIKAINKDVNLPDTNIVVVHRSDSSGTTSIFTDYLAKVSNSWLSAIGRGKSVNWPAGLGAKGNSGVAGLIQQIPGSIGYVELIYALQNKMSAGVIVNKKGMYIKPDIESISLAGAGDIPSDLRVSVTDTDSLYGYPISGFTWIIIYKNQNYNNRSKAKAKETVDLIKWMIGKGQQYIAPMDYSPLSDLVIEKAESLLSQVNYNGEKL
ncbi:phosphate ABC transporter substrate-binding protein PstS [bacterium]|nr:phosphate ABC transporter substrate-binding protein PstS [bacterium]